MRSVKVLTKVDLGSGEYKICEFPQQKPLRRSIDDYTSKLIMRSLQKKDTQDIERQIIPHQSSKRIKPAKSIQNGRLFLSVVGTASQAS